VVTDTCDTANFESCCVVRLCVGNLCAQAGESAGVGNVGARLVSATATAATGLAGTASTSALAATTAALAAPTSTAELATALASTTASLAATEFTAAASATLAATTSTLTTATCSSTGTTLAGRRSEHAVTVELDVDLLLALAFTLSLGSGAGHVGLLLLAGQCLALGELLAATLVGLANVLGTKGELLLGLLDKVGGVRNALVLGLGLRLVLGFSGISDSFLLFGLGNGIASDLVFELSVAVVSAPAVSGLLLLLAVGC
jgi:hypothetical protein